jgi:hypothetical protein
MKHPMKNFADCDLDCNPLEWWKVNASSFPNLKRMARDYLAVPGTEASAEREFSSGKRLITDERGSLGPETIRAMQCLKSWLKQKVFRKSSTY